LYNSIAIFKNSIGIFYVFKAVVNSLLCGKKHVVIHIRLYLTKMDFDTQCKTIEKYSKEEFKTGDTWYLADIKWFNGLKQLIDYGSTSVAIRMNPLNPNHPGPINNNAIFTTNRNGEKILKENLVEDVDYVLLPEAGWQYIVGLYRTVDNNQKIQRNVVKQGMLADYCKVEVYLLPLKLSLNNKQPIVREFSRGAKVSALIDAAKCIFEISPDTDVRLWIKNVSNSYEALDCEGIGDAALYQNQLILVETKMNNGEWRLQNGVFKDEQCSTTSVLSTSLVERDRWQKETIESERQEMIESVIECAICLSIMNDPQILPCFHSFCNICIRRMQCIIIEGQRGFYCPTCRHL
jgi:hypothetical protein